ncbi:cytochrome-c peroxidase [Caulobacter sp. S45]|jgi:cytochrome c peroxidase|uniref:cytochrome-c peroxidase n=1 Tax=Caulobacter sp. S45 TaxID=1641861 RepID=UPI00131E3936|nr:cytochrome c peroxidase [Caulobacter sp. S45]
MTLRPGPDRTPNPFIGNRPRRQIAKRPSRLVWGVAGLVAALLAGGAYAIAHPERAPSVVGAVVEDLTGANPHPVKLLRPPTAPLSALALLGQQIFNDPSLSASGAQSCASCHSPQHDYGPPNDLPVQRGGAHMTLVGFRPPPSLAYLYRQAPFSIGPDAGETDNPVPLNQTASQTRGAAIAAKTAGGASAAPSIVPQGGLFWDGRNDTLMAQAKGPLMNPVEMANASEADVARKLAQAKYRDQFKPLFGDTILSKPAMLVAEAMSAVSRYQIEDRSFHAFDSKYDRWLEGKARLDRAELRGMRLFNDPAKANCGGCHLSQPTRDRLPPLFTDTQYEALGVPRNPAIPANKDPAFFDLGLCGPFRTDLAKQTQYCGMFLTPTLRNAARRKTYFHNGMYHSLDQVMDFYNLRNTSPGKVYPHDAAGKVQTYNDLPAAYRANVDVKDAPFDRKPGDRPALSDAEIKDIIAFIRTLNDGYRPGA